MYLHRLLEKELESITDQDSSEKLFKVIIIALYINAVVYFPSLPVSPTIVEARIGGAESNYLCK